jgi:hypothetical protein
MSRADRSAGDIFVRWFSHHRKLEDVPCTVRHPGGSALAVDVGATMARPKGRAMRSESLRMGYFRYSRA